MLPPAGKYSGAGSFACTPRSLSPFSLSPQLVARHGRKWTWILFVPPSAPFLHWLHTPTDPQRQQTNWTCVRFSLSIIVVVIGVLWFNSYTQKRRWWFTIQLDSTVFFYCTLHTHLNRVLSISFYCFSYCCFWNLLDLCVCVWEFCACTSGLGPPSSTHHLFFIFIFSSSSSSSSSLPEDSN